MTLKGKFIAYKIHLVFNLCMSFPKECTLYTYKDQAKLCEIISEMHRIILRLSYRRKCLKMAISLPTYSPYLHSL